MPTAASHPAGGLRSLAYRAANTVRAVKDFQCQNKILRQPMGRPPKDRRIHHLRGTYREDRHGKITAPPPPTEGQLSENDCPDFLNGRARDLWKENVGQLTWLTPYDTQSLGIWCALTAEFEAEPISMTSARLNQLRLIAGEIGMTATGRARLGVSTEPPGPPDPADKYLE